MWMPPPLFAVPCEYGAGMCVSADLDVVVVSATGSKALSVYTLSDGAFQRSFGGRGVGVGQFNFDVGGLCLTPRGSVLVAEAHNNRVQEVALADGAHVRFVGVLTLRLPQCVDCSGSMVAVSEDCHRVSLFSWPDGVFLMALGEGMAARPLQFPRGVHLLGDGTVSVVDSGNNRVCVFEVTSRQYLSGIAGPGLGMASPHDVLPRAGAGVVVSSTATDTLVAISPRGVQVFEMPKGERAMARPTAIASIPRGYVVREFGCWRVFKNVVLRLAWVAAAVTVSRAYDEQTGLKVHVRSGV